MNDNKKISLVYAISSQVNLQFHVFKGTLRHVSLILFLASLVLPVYAAFSASDGNTIIVVNYTNVFAVGIMLNDNQKNLNLIFYCL